MIQPQQHSGPSQLAADALRDTLADVFAHERFQWDAPRRSILGDIFRWLLDRWNELNATYPALSWIVVGAIAVLVATSFSRYGARIWHALRSSETAGPEPDRAIEPRGPEWYVRRASELRSAGRYRDALAHLFAALLLQLDRHQILEFHPSKTPAEYLTEAKLDEAGQRRFRQIVFDLYDHLFGGKPCADEDLQSFERQAADLGVQGAAR